MATLWSYQSMHPWVVTGGTLSDQARLWINALYKTVSTNGAGGGVQLGGDLGGTNASPLVIGIEGRPVSAAAPADTQVLTWVAADGQWEPKTPAPPNTGTVTSVALAMPVEFTVTGSPVTSAGTLTAAKASQAAHTVYAGPSSGSAAPTFRALAQADMPAGIAPQVQTDWNATSGLAQILNKPPFTYDGTTIHTTAQFQMDGSKVLIKNTSSVEFLSTGGSYSSQRMYSYTDNALHIDAAPSSGAWAPAINVAPNSAVLFSAQAAATRGNNTWGIQDQGNGTLLLVWQDTTGAGRTKQLIP